VAYVILSTLYYPNTPRIAATMDARITNVIVVTHGSEQQFFTLDGVLIGQQAGGPVPTKTFKSKPKSPGGIVTAPSPKEVKRLKRRQGEKALTLVQQLKHEKEQNT